MQQCTPKQYGTAVAGAALALTLLASCGKTPPSQLSQLPADLGKQEVEASGIYDDGWTAETASANLRQPGGDEVLSVRGSVPKIDNAGFQTEVKLLVDNAEIGRRSVGVGDFQLSAPVKSAGGKRRVTVAFSTAQQLPGQDGRTVGAQLKFFGFEPAKSAAAEAASDIASGANLQLGSGWGPIETFRGDHFRWVDNDATLLVTPEKSGDMELSLTVEAGPGVGGKCLLKAVDTSGRQVAAGPIHGKVTVQMFLPAEGGKANEFKLHVDGGGKKVASDPRVLNFRVFEATAKPR